ncbi:MAG: hypothetical protein EHM47_00940 [Ignavibacteriales bacterium]|nr:MAG: hypothetical protein EHM47_00940 [Ignavibacteriales bacterium]
MAFSSPGGMNSTVDLFTWANSVTDSWFIPGILVATYIIIFIKMLTNSNNTSSKAFAAASFMVMILSVFARVMNFVSTGFMSVFIILTAFGAVWMHIENTG